MCRDHLCTVNGAEWATDKRQLRPGRVTDHVKRVSDQTKADQA
jgi:hypothetical protein